MSSNVLTTLTIPLTRVKLKSNNFDSVYDAHQRWIKYMISLIRKKFDSTVNQMRPLPPLIRIKGNQRRPLTIFDHTFDVRKGVFSCSAIIALTAKQHRGAPPPPPPPKKNKINNNNIQTTSEHPQTFLHRMSSLYFV